MSYVVRRGPDGQAQVVELDDAIPTSTTSLRLSQDGKTQRVPTTGTPLATSFTPPEISRQRAEAFNARGGGVQLPELHPHAYGPRRQSVQLVWKKIDGKQQQVYEIKAHHGAEPSYRWPGTGRPCEQLNKATPPTRPVVEYGRLTAGNADRGLPYDPNTGQALNPEHKPMTLIEYQRSQGR